VVLLGGLIELRHHVDDQRSVRADMRVGDAFHRQEIFDRHGPSGGKQRRRELKKHKNREEPRLHD
jgi:RimJ/RimL family protein N-acetyltransferase